MLLHFPVDCCGKLRDSAEVCRGKANFITTISYIRLLVHNTQILTLNLYSLCLNFPHVLVFSMLRLNVFLTSRVQTNPACRYIAEVILSIKTPMKKQQQMILMSPLLALNIRDALCNLLPLVKFKKHLKHIRKSINFIKSNTPPRQFFTFFKCINSIKLRKASHIQYINLVLNLSVS